MKEKSKILFILKRRQDYSNNLINANKMTVATGMWNSVKFIVDMLNESGIDAKQVMVIDNNGIDKEVSIYNPTHVIIEGYWVVPKKFDVLKKLYPDITWCVRCHSATPFLSNEGIAFEWTAEYLRKGITVISNCPKMYDEFKIYNDGVNNGVIEGVNEGASLKLLTNYYPIEKEFNNNQESIGDKGSIAAGCFGAIRPLKNQMEQALAAYIYAQKHHKYLYFNINNNRIEGNGDSIIRNLRAFFQNLKEAELVEHPWLGHDEFLELLSTMDICMQVSFSETFNIVAADAVYMNIPVLASAEVPFIYKYIASPVSSKDMANKMECILNNKHIVCRENRHALRKYSEESKKMWLKWLQ